MRAEYDALIRNSILTLVSLKPRQNVVGNKWVFRIKQNLNDSIARYIVAKGFHQQSNIDFHETFNPVINLITVHTVLSIALNCKWGICQLDVNNASQCISQWASYGGGLYGATTGHAKRQLSASCLLFT